MALYENELTAAVLKNTTAMDGNEVILEVDADTEQNLVSKTPEIELQDLSSQCVNATNIDIPECFLESSKRIHHNDGKSDRGGFAPTSDTDMYDIDKLKLDYLVSRPFLRPSASAPGLGWSRSSGLKLILAYSSTKSEITPNKTVKDTAIVGTNSSSIGLAPKKDVAPNEELGSNSLPLRSDEVESTRYCPTFFYSFDEGSNKSSSSDEGLDGNLCKICYMGDRKEKFIQPPACACSGTMQYCHQSCLSNWVAQSGIKKCELCGYRFRIRTLNMLRIANWSCIPMTTLDKLYIWLFILASSFILTTGVYVCWAMLSTSAAATTERESTAAQVLFPVYTGFDLFCLSIIMYVLKGRITQMWRKWRAHNRSIVILSRPTEQEV